MSIIDDLNVITDEGVTTILPMLREMTTEGYIGLLERCYQLTYEAEPRLSYAQKVATLPDLHASLSEMLEEEKDHHKLAERDLSAYGRPAPAPRPPAILAFDRCWYAITQESQLAFASVLYVFEGVTPRVAPEIGAMRKRLDVSDERMQFFREHISVDDHHTDMFRQICERYADTHAELMVQWARRAKPLVCGMATGVVPAGLS